MGSIGREISRRRAAWNPAPILGAALLVMSSVGCGSGASPKVPAVAPRTSPQTYLAPIVSGATTDGSTAFNGPQIYAIDDFANAYSQTSYYLNPPQQEGAQILNSGKFSASTRGLLSLTLTAHYVFNSTTNVFSAVAPDKPAGGFALELAEQAGGLIQLVGQPVSPLVPTAICPNIPKVQSFNFLTIPTYLPTADSNKFGWSPSTQTAYGSVDVTSDGSSVKFTNIQQSTFPSAGANAIPADPSKAAVDGTCGRTAYGNTISIPGQIIVASPGNSASSPPQAIASIGPTGMLVEDNGLTSGRNNAGSFQNALGAGTGAVGLPKPSLALDTTAIVGAQYLGFVYGSGVYSIEGPPTGLSSHLVSFGFSGAPPMDCPPVPANSTNVVYGGDFTNDDPSISIDGFGHCDLAVVLNAQSTSQNGLYPNATVLMGQQYLGNAAGSTYPFDAVAIAGQLHGKSVIFVLGVDPRTSQAWSIYLLQSN